MDITSEVSDLTTNIINSDSPDIVDEDIIESCLNFIKAYQSDEKKELLLNPKGSSHFQKLPEFIKVRTKQEYSNYELENIIPNKDDMKSITDIFTKLPKFIDYQTLCDAYNKFPKKFQQLFTPKFLFNKIFEETEENYKQVPKDEILNLYLQKQDLIGYLGCITQFSRTKEGYLTFEELMLYLSNVLDNCDVDIRADMKKYAAEIYAEMIIFRLDFKNSDQISISDLFQTDIMPQIFALGDYYNNEGYFSINRLTIAFDQYMEECAGSGLIKDQIYTNFPTIPKSFWDRYFDVYCSNGFMYFADFYKYLYCCENLTELVVIKYFFKIFDVDGDGEITINDLKFFHQDMMTLLENMTGSVIDINDIYDGLYDMCLAKPPKGITINDVLESGRADTLLGVLIDVNNLKKFELAEAGEAEENYEEE